MTRFWFWSIDRYFDIGDVRRVDDPSELCPCAPVVGQRKPLMFEHTIADLVQRPPYINASGVLIDGYFQSWKYASDVEYELRQSLRWKPSITSAVSRSSMMLCHCVIIAKLQEHSETTKLSECNVNV